MARAVHLQSKGSVGAVLCVRVHVHSGEHPSQSDCRKRTAVGNRRQSAGPPRPLAAAGAPPQAVPSAARWLCCLRRADRSRVRGRLLAASAGRAAGAAGSPLTLAAQAERGEIQPSPDRPGGSAEEPENLGSTGSHLDSVWKPMRHSAKKSWSWMDWSRYLFYRSDSLPVVGNGCPL